MSIDANQIFEDPNELAKWLTSEAGFNMTKASAEQAAEKLHGNGYDEASAFYDMSWEEDLKPHGVVKPLGNKVLNGWKLWKNRLAQQQQALTDAPWKEQINAISKQLNQALMKDSFAVSYSNYYDEKKRESRISENWQADKSENNLSQDLLAVENETGPEKKKVKPFWQKFMEDDGNFIVPGIKNGYETANLGPKTPDICFYQTHVSHPTAESFVAAGDCKGEGWTDTSGAEKGQIMLYLHKMLEAQPNREHAYGFVTNNKNFILVKATRADASPFKVIWSISEVLDYRIGMQLFVDLMTTDNGYRANPQFNGNPVSIQKQLRPGGTCRAYVGSFQGNEVVVKVYSTNEHAEKNHNKIITIANALTNSNDGGAELPKSCGLSQNWLLVTPKGEPFTETSFSGSHLTSVIRTLQRAHEKGYVHRDVRLANMFDLGSGKVLLNDWGSLAAKGVETPYEGSPYLDPSLQKDIPSPQHDLYSLVYSIAKLVAPGFNPEAIKAVFNDSFVAAEKVDYQLVERSLKSFLLC